jgi:hypothetical protein
LELEGRGFNLMDAEYFDDTGPQAQAFLQAVRLIDRHCCQNLFEKPWRSAGTDIPLI